MGRLSREGEGRGRRVWAAGDRGAGGDREVRAAEATWPADFKVYPSGAGCNRRQSGGGGKEGVGIGRIQGQAEATWPAGLKVSPRGRTARGGQQRGESSEASWQRVNIAGGPQGSSELERPGALKDLSREGGREGGRQGGREIGRD